MKLKKYLILIFLFCCFAQNTRAQQQEIDSLKKLLETTQHDTLRVNQLNRLGFIYYTTKPDTTLRLAQEAIALAKQIGYIRGEARGLSVSGAAFYVTGNFPKALDLFLNSLKKYESINDFEGIANSTNNIGTIYNATGDYRKGLKYFFRSLDHDKKTGNKSGMAICLSNISVVYSDLKILDSARSYALQAYDLAFSKPDIRMRRITSSNLGRIYFQMEQPGIALEYYRKAFALGKGEDDVLTSEISLGMAQVFLDRKEQDSTLHYANHAYNISEKDGFTDQILEASTFLADYYESNGEIDSSHFYLKASLAAKDSLYSQEKANKVQALALEESRRQQEKAEALLKIEEKQKLNLQYIAIAGGITLLVLLFIVLSRSIIVNEKWIGFMGILMLLIVFEFINLLLTTQIAEITNYNPIWTLLIMVGVAALLIPLYHKTEQYVTKKMTRKNRKIRLAAARKTLKELEMEEQD